MLLDFFNFYNNIIDYIEISEFPVEVQIVSGIVSAWLLFLIIILIKRLLASGAIKKPVISTGITGETDKLTKEWNRIIGLLKSNNEASLKLAVIEADKLLDEILQRANFPGKDMGERLENIDSSQIKSIDDVWRGHKIRNRIAHEAGFRITLNDAESALRGYEKALRELEAIEE